MICLVIYFPLVYGQSFDPVINLSDVTRGADCQSIKVSGNNVYVAWSDHSNGDILFRKSADDGKNFGIAQDLSTSTGSSACPTIAVTDNNVFVVWNEVSQNGDFDVYFRKSSNAGAAFDPIRNLSHNSGDSSFPNIASVGMRVYVVWDDDTLPGDFMTFFTRSPDSGTSFGPVKNLVKPPINEALNARVAVSGHTVYVVWTGNAADLNQVYMRISNDGGNNFGTTKNLSNSKSDSGRANLKASGNNVYVAWQSEVQAGNEDIIFRKSTNKGSTFGSPVNISNNPSPSLDPIINNSGDSVYIVWTDGTDSNSDILFRRSINKGTNFDQIKNLSDNPSKSFEPFLTKDGNNVQVTWQDTFFGNDEILIRSSTDSGQTFHPTVDISNSMSKSVLPKAASSNGIIYETWIEQTANSDDLLFTKASASLSSQGRGDMMLPLS
jgi:hypothetical protein